MSSTGLLLSKKQKTQVVIIGAGPSGSLAAALLVKHDIDVIVIEKSLFPRFSIGESLLPACMEVIKKAGMLEAVIGGDFQFKNGAAFRSGERSSEFDFTDKFTEGEGTTFQVQRGDFDKIIADDAQKKVASHIKAEVDKIKKHNAAKADHDNKKLAAAKKEASDAKANLDHEKKK